MSTNRIVVLVVFFAIVSFATFAQSNETIDSILAEDPGTTGSATYLALTAAGLLDDASSPQKAVAVAVEAGWLSAEAAESDTATFGVLAHLLMQAYEVQGGLMYRIAPGPRYAAREFVFQGWCPVQKAPSDIVSGEFMVQITGLFLEDQEARR